MNSTYKIDFINNTLTMSKAFEAAASNPNSKEYKLLQQLRADFPGLTVARKTRRASKKAQPTKNLTYANIYEWEEWDNAAGLTDKTQEVYQLIKENFDLSRPMSSGKGKRASGKGGKSYAMLEELSEEELLQQMSPE